MQRTPFRAAPQSLFPKHGIQSAAAGRQAGGQADLVGGLDLDAVALGGKVLAVLEHVILVVKHVRRLVTGQRPEVKHVACRVPMAVGVCFVRGWEGADEEGGGVSQWGGRK